MVTRLDLQNKLEEILGARRVYFQPPESVKLKYPCIIYGLNRIENKTANDCVYKQDTYYEITVIDTNPDNTYKNDVSKIPSCRYDRRYVADNLYHDVFVLYL